MTYDDTATNLLLPNRTTLLLIEISSTKYSRYLLEFLRRLISDFRSKPGIVVTDIKVELLKIMRLFSIYPNNKIGNKD